MVPSYATISRREKEMKTIRYLMKRREVGVAKREKERRKNQGFDENDHFRVYSLPSVIKSHDGSEVSVSNPQLAVYVTRRPSAT